MSLRSRLGRLEQRAPELGCEHCRPLFDGPIRIIEANELAPAPSLAQCPKCGRRRPERIYFVQVCGPANRPSPQVNGRGTYPEV